MWLHYSGDEVTFESLVNREQEEPSIFGKPRGLWITDETENNWHAWCTAEGFGIENLTNRHEVTLDETDIIILRTVGDIDLFTNWYSTSNRRLPELRRKVIDWPRVARQYHGIIITPYQWARRMTDHTSWYYGWDCASGCIWNVSAIKGIRLANGGDDYYQRFKELEL